MCAEGNKTSRSERRVTMGGYSSRGFRSNTVSRLREDVVGLIYELVNWGWGVMRGWWVIECRSVWTCFKFLTRCQLSNVNVAGLCQ